MAGPKRNPKKVCEENESKFYIPDVIDEKLRMTTETDKKKEKEFPDRVLIVRRGFGGKDKIRYKTVSGLVKHVSMFDGYDPTQSSESEVERYSKQIEEFRPDLLISCSSGATVICHLVRKGIWKGSTWIVSTRTSPPKLYETLKKDLPVLFSQGTRDGVPPQHFQRNVRPKMSRCEIMSFEGGHAAIELFENEKLVRSCIEKAYSLRLAKPRETKKVRPSLFDAIRKRK